MTNVGWKTQFMLNAMKKSMMIKELLTEKLHHNTVHKTVDGTDGKKQVQHVECSNETNSMLIKGGLKKDSVEHNVPMGRQKEERACGVNVACTTKEIFTEKSDCTIIDASWYRNPIKSIITGPSQEQGEKSSLETKSMLIEGGSKQHSVEESMPTDRQEEESRCGVTKVCIVKEPFTEKLHYTDFIKNMITGSMADAGNFTTAIAEGDHQAGEILRST